MRAGDFEPMRRLSAPVRHGAFVECAPQAGRGRAFTSRPEPLADGERTAHPVFVEPVTPICPAVGDGPGTQCALAGLGRHRGLVDNGMRVVELRHDLVGIDGLVAVQRHQHRLLSRQALQAIQVVRQCRPPVGPAGRT